MANIKSFISEFLTAEEIKEAFIAVIQKEPLEDKGEKFTSWVTEIMFEGQQRKLSINKTNARVLSDAWGDETSKWIGKQIQVSTLMKDVFGKQKKVITLVPGNELKPEAVSETAKQKKARLEKELADVKKNCA